MRLFKEKRVKIWLILILAIGFCTLGSGFYKDLSANDEETYKGLKLFSDVVDLIEKNYVDPVDSKDLINKAIQGMVTGLDPHSQLLPPEAFEELQIDTKGEFGGIGIVITMKKGLLTVIAPIEGTPAFKAGIKAGDIIIKVDGEPTKDMMLWEAVKKMRGPKGESVKITVLREGNKKPIDYKLIRDNIPIKSVRYISLKGSYGYCRITNFQENTRDDLENALQDLESLKGGMKGLILDLRDNPGGLLNQAVSVSDLFLDKGVIVTIKGRLKRHTKVFKATPLSSKRKYPIVVLINGGSASASEIVAGALQDHKRAVILGTTSFGKGSVQTVETLRDGYGLKFTIARYYTPNGRSIQAQGIVPDVIVPHTIIEKSSPQDENILKEKDLKNHLKAETFPEKAEEEKTDKKQTLNKDNRYGKLEREVLLTDSQVVRSLEVLIGYNILQAAPN